MKDNVEHTGKAFLGLTFNCAHCHDHKYDPITHEDYFAFRAFFEPLELRHDRVPGEPDPGPYPKYDYGKAYKPITSGMVRVFDEKLDAQTFLYTRRRVAERRRRAGRRSRPGVPDVPGRPVVPGRADRAAAGGLVPRAEGVRPARGARAARSGRRRGRAGLPIARQTAAADRALAEAKALGTRQPAGLRRPALDVLAFAEAAHPDWPRPAPRPRRPG